MTAADWELKKTEGNNVSQETLSLDYYGILGGKLQKGLLLLALSVRHFFYIASSFRSYISFGLKKAWHLLVYSIKHECAALYICRPEGP